MAFKKTPSSSKRPAKGSKAAFRPLSNVGKVISPTGVCALLSVAAHAVLFAYGPRTGFSWAAATQSQSGESGSPQETVVPLVQLSAAEQSRLPSFAQPRRAPSTTGLGNLSLPSGIPSVPNTSIPKQQAARPFPSPTLSQPNQRRIPNLNRTIPNLTRTQPPRGPIQFPIPSFPTARIRQTSPTVVVPDSLSPDTSDRSASSAAPGVDAADDLPTLESGVAALGTQNIPEPPGTSSAANEDTPDIGSGLSSSGSTEDGPSVAVIVEDPNLLSMATAQGNPDIISSDLAAANTYNDALISGDAVEDKIKAWESGVVQNKGAIATAEVTVTVDSGFKACREIPPQDGLLGVVINPDGTQEELEVLQSTGYDVINRTAVSTVKASDFGPVEAPTQYKVEVDVIYGEGCVTLDDAENLVEAPAEGEATNPAPTSQSSQESSDGEADSNSPE